MFGTARISVGAPDLVSYGILRVDLPQRSDDCQKWLYWAFRKKGFLCDLQQAEVVHEYS